MSAKISGASGKHNLPHQLTNFIGREQILAELGQLFGQNRLLTLTGTGGVGKTRLALQTADQQSFRFKDGVWLVELAALTDPLLVVPALLQTLNLKEEPGQPLLTTLIAFLQPKEILLVLDNCEHLIEQSAKLADQILKACSQVNILATSREALNIGGEITFRVPSLALPQLTALPSPSVQQGQPLKDGWQYLNRFEAVQLFVERAQAVQPDFQLTAQNAQAIVQICRRLDGIPLALELAAARLRGLGIEQLALRLNDRFCLLTGGSRIALPRQQTLQALIDWSYNLLTEAEKVVLRRLAVFVGSFSLEAAETVCAGEYTLTSGWGRIEPEQVLDLVWQLVNKSLVVIEHEQAKSLPNQNCFSTQTRYHLLEIIREYALKQLEISEEENLIREKHANYYSALAQETEPKLRGKEQLIWLGLLESEHPNLITALQWFVHNRQTPTVLEQSLKLASSLNFFWLFQARYTEGRKWLSEVLACDLNVSPQLRKVVVYLVGALAWYQGEVNKFEEVVEESLAIVRDLDNKHDLGVALLYAAFKEIRLTNNLKAISFLEESIKLLRGTNDSWFFGSALFYLAVLKFNSPRPDYTQVQKLFEETLPLAHELEDRWILAQVNEKLALIALMQHNYSQAIRYWQENFVIAMELKNSSIVSWSLLGLAWIMGVEENYALAAKLYGAATKSNDFVNLSTILPLPAKVLFEGTIALIQTKLGKEEFANYLAEGREMAIPLVAVLVEELTPTRQVSSSFQSKTAQDPIISPTRSVYLNGLTGREVEVLKLVATGRSNPEIAEALTLSRKTVEAHLRSIFAKLEVTSRSAATRFAFEHHLI